MKHTIVLLSILLLQYGSAQAQDFNVDKNNYLILSKNINQIKPILLTAKELAIEDGDSFGSFYVIICGSTVKDIPGNHSFDKLLSKARENHIKVFVCGLSLDKFKVDKQKLPRDLELTKNGIHFGFQLAKKGFITLTI